MWLCTLTSLSLLLFLPLFQLLLFSSFSLNYISISYTTPVLMSCFIPEMKGFYHLNLPFQLSSPTQSESQGEFGRKQVVESEKGWWGRMGSWSYVRHPSGLLVCAVGEKSQSQRSMAVIDCVYSHGRSAKGIHSEMFWISLLTCRDWIQFIL